MNEQLNAYYNSITESSEYKSYVNFKEKLKASAELMELINEIKRLRKKLCQIDYHDTTNYVNTKEELESIVDLLELNKDYRNYKEAQNKLYNSVNQSKETLEKYFNSIV